MVAAALNHLVPSILRSNDHHHQQHHNNNNDPDDGSSTHGTDKSTKPTQSPAVTARHDSQTNASMPPPPPSQSLGQPAPLLLHHHSSSQSQWSESQQSSQASIAAIAQPTQSGHSSRLTPADFSLLKTLGTGTFARVWLVRMANARPEDEERVYALKVLRKVDIIRLKQVEHVSNERNILAKVAGHPFITNMLASFQDHDSLYMLLDYCPGGEVFSYLRRARRFNEPTSQFYAAEICLILEYLHEREGIAYRDLKPENILIDHEGHLKLVDFGFAKKIDSRETYTLCGTPEYLAPEVIRNTGHGTPVDWWAFGILIYEFLVGQPPFWDQNPMRIYEQIVEGNIRFPAAMSQDARAIILGLCNTDISKRLGNISGGAATVKAHPWFKTIDWNAMYHRRVKGPIIPHLRGPSDTRNFDEYEPEAKNRPAYTEELRRRYDESFKDFNHV